ncbi:MAG: hypothetical protein AAFX52_04895 [Pseudomonadota bacterium]
MISLGWRHRRTLGTLAALAVLGAQAKAAPVTFDSQSEWLAAADNANTYTFDFDDSEVVSQDDQFLRFAQTVSPSVPDEVGVTVSGIRGGDDVRDCRQSNCIFVDNILSDSVIGMDQSGTDAINQALLQFQQIGGLRITGAYFTFANIDTGDEPNERTDNNSLIEMQSSEPFSPPTTVASASIQGKAASSSVGFLFQDAEDTFVSALFGANQQGRPLGTRISRITLITLDDHQAAIEAASMDDPDDGNPGGEIPLPGSAILMLSAVGLYKSLKRKA